MAQDNPQALERQIAELQKQLESARAQAGADSGAPYERREVHAALGERIQQQMPSYQPPAAQPAPAQPAPAGGDVPSYQDPALAPQVQQLVTVAFTQSIQDAIAQAVRTRNAALVDALHDVLADELYQELIKRQKLQPAA